MVKARQNASLPIDSAPIDNVILAVKYFEKHKDTKNTGIANFYVARSYKSDENLEKEFAFYLKTLPYAKVAKYT